MPAEDDSNKSYEPQSNSESDPRFPSGEWEGFFLMRPTGRKRHMMELMLGFCEGRIIGEGRDYVGRFTVRGEYGLDTGKCLWKKSYVQKHDVIYEGYNEGRGIFGKWEINEFVFVSTGGFLIWPKGMGDPTNHRRRAEVDVPESDGRLLITEDDFATVSAESAGMSRSIDESTSEDPD